VNSPGDWDATVVREAMIVAAAVQGLAGGLLAVGPLRSLRRDRRGHATVA
jgi:hypothetical protein